MPSEKPKKIQYSGDSKVLKAIIGIGNWLLDNLYELPIASDETLGGVKVGDNLSIDENGVLSADATSIDELNDIGDVNIESPSDGQVLKYDSTSEMWTNGDASMVSDLDDLEDVNISNLSPGQILKYGGTSEGWVNEDENSYELPKASSSVLGGIKVGNNLSIDSDGTLNASSGASSLDALSDVDITTPSVGDILKYGGTSVGWINGEDSGGVAAVELTYAQYQALTTEQKNDPTKEYFVTDYPDGEISLEDLADTDITTPSDKQVLMYNSTSDEWTNGDIGVEDLSDISFNYLTDGDFLTYDYYNQIWKNARIGENAIQLYTSANVNDNARISSLSGWIVRIGYLVFIECHITISSAYTSSNLDTKMIKGITTGDQYKQPLLIYGGGINNPKVYVDGNGIYNETEIAAGDYTICGTYLYGFY